MAIFGFSKFNNPGANQALVLAQQVTEHRQAQNVYTQISANARQAKPSHTPAPGQQMQLQMQMMLVMMAMMQSMAQLSGGFSNFLGGPSQPQYPAPYAANR
jgi:hypothetical protein